jgi:ribosomal protein S18 acetylase RimI-like enzyme
LSVDLRIQQSVVANLASRPAAVESGPFIVGIDPATDSPNINYATPRPGAEIKASDVEALVETFRSAGLRPRLEYVVNCAPTLEELLIAAGFTVEERHEFLICPTESLVPPPPVDGFSVRSPENRSERAALVAAQGEAFGGAFEVSDTDVDRLEALLRRGGFEVAALTPDGVCAGGGQAVPPGDGVSEIAGIAVRAPYRRRGLGGAITAEIARQIFASGADLAWLEASGDDSWRVYERIGFRPAGRRLYIRL